MGDILKILEIASKLSVPGLVLQGVEFIVEVKAASDRAKHVLTAGEQADLDAAHAAVLARIDSLDRKLADAEKR